MSFERAVEFVLRYEGEISDSAMDIGILTKWGISSRTFQQVKNPWFSRQDAIEIYKTKFWDSCKCSELPWPPALLLFNAAVNQVPQTAIRLFQKSLGVAVDGAIGPETIQAAQRASVTQLAAELAARCAYQYSLHPSVMRFGLGWYRRLMACHQLAMEPE